MRRQNINCPQIHGITPGTGAPAHRWLAVATVGGGASTNSCVARPIYAGGTTHTPTAEYVAHRPTAAFAPPGSDPLVGFAVVGGLNVNGQRDAALIQTDTDGLNPVVATVPDKMYAAGSIPWCGDLETHTDWTTDVEQDGNELVVAGLFNFIDWGATGCVPPANPLVLVPRPGAGRELMVGKTYLLRWPVGFASTSSPDFTQFVNLSAGGEFRPQVEPTADHQYLVATSVLGSNFSMPSQYELNLHYLGRFDGTATPTPTSTSLQWERTFTGPRLSNGEPSQLACTFGLALMRDGGYLVSGNNRGPTNGSVPSVPPPPPLILPTDHDAVFIKFAPG